MKAVIVRDFGSFDQAEVRHVPDPVPGPGEVVIAVKVADVNYPDFLVIEGRYRVKPPLPFSPGKAGAGVIETVGAQALARLKAGSVEGKIVLTTAPA